MKVGGSLFDWPDLKPRLASYLASLGGEPVLLVPGGGRAADAVRELDRVHSLGEVKSHWLALRSLTTNAHFLADLLGLQVTESLHAARFAWRRTPAIILDPLRFARGDESRPDHLPHVWTATSDSIAARVARVAEAQRLILLKSVAIPSAMDWTAAAQRGLVDKMFAELVAGARFTVEGVNLRTWNDPVAAGTIHPV